MLSKRNTYLKLSKDTRDTLFYLYSLYCYKNMFLSLLKYTESGCEKSPDFLINFCEKETRKKCSIKSFIEKITKNGNKLGKIAKLIIASDKNLTSEIITKKEYMELKSVCNQFKEKYKDASNRLNKIKEQVIK